MPAAQAQAQQPYGQGYVTTAGVYGVYGGYGVPAYYGANTAWNRDATYSKAAREGTEARMSSFHSMAATRR